MGSMSELAESEHITRRRASIIIPTDVHHRAKARAATCGRSLGEWAADVLVKALDDAEQAQQARGRDAAERA